MRGCCIKTRLLEDERGFTLSEMMVTIVIMIVVFFSLHSVFDMSMRIFAFGNNKVEAVENARLGLEKMEREIRAAYPVNPNAPNLFFSANGATSNPPSAMPTSTQITFGNERGAGGAGDKQITCISGAPCEYITYKLVGGTLMRNSTLTGSTSDTGNQPVVENVVPGGLTFTYYADDGSVVTGTDEAAIKKVRVRLRITVSEGTRYEATQNLTTEIDLRNR